MELKNIDIREEYYTDTHQMKPAWWMRWGILTVFIILFILIALGYVVQYPDVIYAEFKFTTNKPTITLPLQNSSQIDQVFVTNESQVTPDQHLVLIKNNSRYSDVMFLEKELEKLTVEEESLIAFFEKTRQKDLVLGNILENDWITLSNHLLEYYKIVKLNFYQNKVNRFEKEMQSQEQLKQHYQKLTIMDLEEKQLLKKSMATDSILLAEQVISRIDYNNNKRGYLNSIKNLEQNNQYLKQNELNAVRLENSIASAKELESQSLLQLDQDIRKAINRLRSSLNTWEKAYLLTSPIQGTVSFIQLLEKNKFFEGNAIVITPSEKEYHAVLTIPFSGAGKVKENQKVILKLNDYPYREYGYIEGTLQNVSLVAGEQSYLAKVELENNNMTTYKKEVLIKENMGGLGEIVTHDRSILERMLDKVFYVIKK